MGKGIIICSKVLFGRLGFRCRKGKLIDGVENWLKKRGASDLSEPIDFIKA